jgi:hypothetical protein
MIDLPIIFFSIQLAFYIQGDDRYSTYLLKDFELLQTSEYRYLHLELEESKTTDYQGFGSGSGFNRASGSGSGFRIRIRIQEGKNDPQK